MMRSLAIPLRTVFESPAGYVLVAFLGLLVTLPSLGMGFFLDDYAQLALVESWYPENAGIFDLYAFLGDLPLDPWWKHPEFKISMWRPLTSMLLQLDNRLFGHNAVGYHIHSILWYLGVVAACGLLFSRILPRGVAVLALLVFALDESHLLTAGWIANRHAMVAMLPSLLGVYAHLRWREEGWRPGLPLSILGYVIGLTGGEGTLGIMVYVFTYEVFAGLEPWRRRIPYLLPIATVGGCYALFYKFQGFGSANSGFYLDPVGEPVAFVLGAATNIPVLLAAAFLGFTSDLGYFVAELRPLQVAAGWTALALFAVILWMVWSQLAERERRAMRWLVPGAALSLLPNAVAQPFDRGLIGPMVGGAVLIALVLTGCWRRWRGATGAARRAAAVATVLLAVVHLALPAFTRITGQFVTARQWDILREMAGQIPVDVSAEKPRDVVLLNAPDIVIGGFFPLMHAVQGKSPFRLWDNLSLAPYDLLVTRKGPRTLEIVILDGRLLTSPPERFHLPLGSRLTTGDTASGRTFEVEILADDGLGPTRLEFRFDRDLEDPSLAFLKWTDQGLRPAELPVDGKTLRVAQAPGAIPLALKGLAPAWRW